MGLFEMKSIISIISFLILYLPVSANQDIKIVSSDRTSTLFEFTPQYDDTVSVFIGNSRFLKVSFFDGFLANPENYGAPALQKKKFSVGVPEEFGNTVQVITVEYKDLRGKIAPIPRLYIKNGITNYQYELNQNYNTAQQSELVLFSDFGISRGMPLQMIDISPVQYDHETERIRLYTKIVFRVNYAVSEKNTLTGVEDELLRDAVVNYSTAKNWIKKTTSLAKTNVNSVLAEGKWYRFEAPSEGIYRIDRQMLASLGIDAATVDPTTIKIYNNGGKELPEGVTSGRPQDLLENAIYIEGEADKKFDEGDYILFYGRGISFWEKDSARNMKRYFHNYSTKNLYWITSGGAPGKRMQLKANRAETPVHIQTTTKAYASWEEDKSKLQQSGRLYLGDEYGENSTKSYMTKLDAVIPNSRITYKFSFVNRAERAVTLIVRESDQEIARASIGGVGIGNLDYAFANRGIPYTGEASYNGALSEERSVLKFNYVTTGSPSIGFLNFFEIYYSRNLKAANGELMFYSADTAGIIQYQLSGFPSSNIKVFNITDHANVQFISDPYVSGGDCIFKANENGKNGSKYFAVENASFKVPVNIEAVQNSNIHGITEGAKFIIITHANFRDQADRLKNHKENDIKVKIPTVVVDINEIFNEYSGGITDVSAVRDFIKYAYDNWQIKPEYVLLFGDGDYDYKNIEGVNQNFIPTYQSAESYSYLGSYVTDDFYARISGDDPVVDIALGRLNILTKEDAQVVVDKIIKYETQKDFGLWRNLVTFVADDGPAAAGDDDLDMHTGQSEFVANDILLPYFDQQKIYLALYPTVQTAIGRRKPAVNKAIVDAINEGTIIVNWVGHGNPDVWAHEYVFEKSTTIPQLRNDKYFFLTAATCDFGRYDIPGAQNQSSTELMITKPGSGTIGTFTAARTVFSNDNAAINNSFYRNLFVRDTLNLVRPVGKSYYITKMAKYNSNDIKFHLFGDPTLRLAVPESPVAIDSINNQNVETEIQIKALSSIRINGTIKRGDETEASDYNGEALISVYDSQRSLVIKEMANRQISLQGGVIYRGRVTVTNGKFSAEFTVPKDISYENKNGKISSYVFNDAADGIGYTKNIIIGGTDSTIANDGKGPEITIAFDNDLSENSYIVSPDFQLNVKLLDQTGLNTTGSGIGHKLQGILNGNENEPIDFTNYFVGDLNAGGRSGVIKYNFTGTELGDYKIQVKAWDVFNNFSSAERGFTVVNGDNIVLRDVYNYPNPFSANTTFTFQHNLPEAVDVKINIYTVAGRKIKVIEQFSSSDKFVRLDWDGRDEDGNVLSNGTYLYKVVVNTVDGRYKQEVLGKLSIIK